LFIATDKIALLIGNSDYKMKPLKCSRNDVEAMTEKFRQLNFKTISLVDLTLSQMANAVEYFCSLLDADMYAVFFFSGHGVDYHNITYLMPTDADEPLKLEQCIDSSYIAMKMQKTLSKVIMIFDCCRVRYDNESAMKTNKLPFLVFKLHPNCHLFNQMHQEDFPISPKFMHGKASLVTIM